MRHVIPSWVITICERLRSVGETSYVVGGAIRDTLLGRPVVEYDMCSSATPEILHALFEKTVDTGVEFGTVTVVVTDTKGHRHSAEITTFRLEQDYTDNRRPDKVTLGASLEDDLSRRDFTINALAYDPLEDRLVDNYHGQEDIKTKCLRTIGHPEDRFTEDTLRLFRAARFSAQLDFDIEAATLDAIMRLGSSCPLPAMERMTMEVRKLLASDFPSRGLIVLHMSKLLERYMPGLNLNDVNVSGYDSVPKHHRLGRLLEYTKNSEHVLKLARYSNSEIDLVQRQIERQFDDALVALNPHDLDVKSQDLKAEGLDGPRLGAAQKALFQAVCLKKVRNSKHELLNFFKTQIQETL